MNEGEPRIGARAMLLGELRRIAPRAAADDIRAETDRARRAEAERRALEIAVARFEPVRVALGELFGTPIRVPDAAGGIGRLPVPARGSTSFTVAPSHASSPAERSRLTIGADADGWFGERAGRPVERFSAAGDAVAWFVRELAPSVAAAREVLRARELG